MSRVPFVLLGALAASLLLPARPASAGDIAALTRAGEAVELRGLRTNVIAFYDTRSPGDGSSLDLTILLSGRAAGGEILRARLPLADGQEHAVSIDDGDGAETFRFARSGDVVTIDLVQRSAEVPVAPPPELADASVPMPWRAPR